MHPKTASHLPNLQGCSGHLSAGPHAASHSPPQHFQGQVTGGHRHGRHEQASGFGTPACGARDTGGVIISVPVRVCQLLKRDMHCHSNRHHQHYTTHTNFRAFRKMITGNWSACWWTLSSLSCPLRLMGEDITGIVRVSPSLPVYIYICQGSSLCLAVPVSIPKLKLKDGLPKTAFYSQPLLQFRSLRKETVESLFHALAGHRSAQRAQLCTQGVAGHGEADGR